MIIANREAIATSQLCIRLRCISVQPLVALPGNKQNRRDTWLESQARLFKLREKTESYEA